MDYRPSPFYTTDGGSTWEIIEHPRIGDSLKAEDGPEFAKDLVDFVDADWGWRASPFDVESVEYSTDRGRSWSTPIKTGVMRRALVFTTREVGWILGDQTVVTRDGGRSWQKVQTLSNHDLRYPYFLSLTHGWIASNDGVLARTNNGGETWDIQHTLPKGVRSIFFINTTQGWAVGDNGLIAVTQDGGVSWEIQDSGLRFSEASKQEARLLDVFFLKSELGWISGRSGILLTTQDAGKTWSRVVTPTKVPLSSIRFVNSLRGWVVGGNPEPAVPFGEPSNVVIETTNGGKTWQIKSF